MECWTPNIYIIGWALQDFRETEWTNVMEQDKGETHEETLTWSVDSQVSVTVSVMGGALPCEIHEEAPGVSLWIVTYRCCL